MSSRRHRLNNYSFPSSRLRDASLSTTTLKLYDKQLLNFLHYTRLTPQQFLCIAGSQLDNRLAAYIEYLHSIGSPYDYASQALFGAVFRRPNIKLKLGISHQCLNGWAKSKTSSSHPPLTWELTVVLAVTQARCGFHSSAVALLLAFHCYLRIGELTRLRRCDIAMERDARMGSGHTRMALRLGVTKTGLNQYVSVDDPLVAACLTQWMKYSATHSTHSVAAHTKSENDLVFAFSPSHFRTLLRCTLSSLHLSHIGYVPHSLRHGGATRDFLLHGRIDSVVFRGRWENPKSARRYVQQGRALLLTHQVPTQLAEVGNRVAPYVDIILNKIMKEVPESIKYRRRVTFADQR